jgi:alcohol dehydrogenase
LATAAKFGAKEKLIVNDRTPDEIMEITAGGARITVDAIGSAAVVQAALASLRPGGRHVQIGLLPGDTTVNVGALIGRELQWLGSHGMSARDYPAMLDLVTSGAVRPGDLVTRVIGLDQVPGALAAMSQASPIGVTVICPAQQPDAEDRADQH